MEINYWDGFLDGVLVMVTVAIVIAAIGAVIAYRWLLREVGETLPSPERLEYERKTKLNPGGGCNHC